ncbi:MAG: ribosome recycling factor [Armatimonadota bacterium]|nr:ribosome recycling factor [Armatimonadota bacterium]MDR7563562.1 ribosome recycling factor [Armatimonadota bacterium]MDR7567731.1 ribosome recycling factor [Armatimonadota bacterium]MDR7601071.1 ribosome recycling factor [Armatimonadota bacterium]
MQEVLADARQRMQKSVEATRRELAGLRTGRAHPGLVEHIRVEYYGTPVPLNQLATITAPEPRLLVIQPWDKSALRNIEKALMQSDLGLNPTSDGNVLRVPIPPLTEERRQDLVRLARKLAEEGRVAVRNIRREAKETIEELEDEGEISEDEARRAQEELQKLTDRFIEEIDALLQRKEAEILEG